VEHFGNGMENLSNIARRYQARHNFRAMKKALRIGLALCARDFLVLVRLPLRALLWLQTWSDDVLHQRREERYRAFQERHRNVLRFPSRTA
jgi:hypothetical protein